VTELPEQHDFPEQTGQGPERAEDRPRPATNTMYMVLFMLAVFGLVLTPIMLKVFERERPSPSPVSRAREMPAVDVEEEMKVMLEEAPWLQAVILGGFLVGIVLLLVYAGLRAGGIRPVRQMPLNKVTWTLGSLAKGFVAALFIIMVLSYTGGPLLEPLGLHWAAAGSLLTAVFEILVVVWVLLMLRFEYDVKPADFGLRFRTPLRDVGYAFITYLAVTPVFTAAAHAWQYIGESCGVEYKVPPLISFLLKSESAASIAVVTVAAVIIAPVAEELFFRAFTYSALRKRLGFLPGVVITSLYFALIHDFFSYLPIFILGIALAFLYERRQSIIAPAALHFFHNARVVGTILLLRYMNS
jgi:membrane protease YdiL (CAAX protease family)